MWGLRSLNVLATVLWLSVGFRRTTLGASQGNFTIIDGQEWGVEDHLFGNSKTAGRRLRSLGNYPGVPISCFSCNILYGQGGYYPSHFSDGTCVPQYKKCDKAQKKCCTGEGLYCWIKSGEAEGVCSYDFSCKLDEDCWRKGPSWGSYNCGQDGKCAKGLCVRENQKCTLWDNGYKDNCCHGEYMRCQTPRGQKVGAGVCEFSTYGVYCDTDEHCTSHGPRFKGYKCSKHYHWCSKPTYG